MKNFIVRFGVLGACVSIALGLINWFTVAQWYGVSMSQAVGYSSIAISMLCIPLGIKYYRDKLNQGHVSFIQAFKIGNGITFVAALIKGLYSVLFFVVEADDFAEWQRKGLDAAQLEQFEQEIANMPDYAMTPWFQGVVMFVMVFIIGFVINLVSSTLMKNSKNA